MLVTQPDRYAIADNLANRLRAEVERAVNAATTNPERTALQAAGAQALQAAQWAFYDGDVSRAERALDSFRTARERITAQRPEFEARERARLEEVERTWRRNRARELFAELLKRGLTFHVRPDGAIRVRGSAAGSLGEQELQDARRCRRELRQLIEQHAANERRECILLPPESESDGDTN
jgi:hypothetical protein